MDPPRAHGAEPIPVQFGKYRLLRRVAFGGMAEIFLAELSSDGGFTKPVVVKRILPQFSDDPSFVRMFTDEAVLAARLNHPNIVGVYDFGLIDGAYFMAMEWVDGVDLRAVFRILQRDQMGMGWSDAALIGEHVAAALAHAHAHTDAHGVPDPIIHRDVSPHNILLNRSGQAKLADFGIAKARDRASQTAAGAIKGKIAYMAPEHVSGRDVVPASDQFALGIVLWELLAGRRLYTATTDLGLMEQVAAADVPQLQKLRPDIPHALLRVVMTMLAYSPAARYHSLEQVAHALGRFRLQLGASSGLADLSRWVEAAAPQSSSAGGQTLPLEQSTAAACADAEPTAVTANASQSGVTHSRTAATSGNAHAARFGADTWRPPAAANAGASKAREAPPQASEPERASTPGRAAGLRGGGGIRRGAVLLWAALGVAAGWAAGAWLRASQQPERSPVKAQLGALQVSSSPPGAEIWLDGGWTGLQTPAQLHHLTLGRRVTVELRHADGWWKRSVVVSRQASIHGQLRPRHTQPDAPIRPAPPHDSAAPGQSSGGTQDAKSQTLSAAGAPPGSIPNRDATAAAPSPASAATARAAGGGRATPAAPPKSATPSSEPKRRLAGTGHSAAPRAAPRQRPPASSSEPGATASVSEPKPNGQRREPTTDASPRAPGRLSLRSHGPWLEVFLGERKLGVTPLSRVQVPSGKLTLTVRNPELDLHKELRLEVAPGELLRYTVSFP